MALRTFVFTAPAATKGEAAGVVGFSRKAALALFAAAALAAATLRHGDALTSVSTGARDALRSWLRRAPPPRGPPGPPGPPTVGVPNVPRLVEPPTSPIGAGVALSWACEDGYNATCSPAFCAAVADRTTPACTGLSSQAAWTAATRQATVSQNTCRACTQSTDARCSSGALTALLGSVRGSGVMAAWCTDAYLVVVADGSTGTLPNLDDVPFPPGGTDSAHGACRTRTATIGPGKPILAKFKLAPTALTTAAATNNMAAFPNGAGDGPGKYLSDTAGAYGLPSASSVGLSVSGGEFYPTFNNRAMQTAENCEVDSCNQHVGGGGGQPHYHGDPFGPTCLYSAANYSSVAAHPPQIGWSHDGYPIHGRYLSTSAPGYTVALDACGTHTHDGLGIHYHTQLLSLVTTGAMNGIASGQAYTGSTVGVYKCWRGDVSTAADPAFWLSGGPSLSAYTAPCCSMTDYYAAPGITIPGAGTQSTTTGGGTSSSGGGGGSGSNTSATAPGSSPSSSSAPSAVVVGAAVGGAVGAVVLAGAAFAAYSYYAAGQAAVAAAAAAAKGAAAGGTTGVALRAPTA